ncbi:lipase [Zhouia sp. PK063]|uniref:lipase n=1 Tax=Zhouia sp. PK063 TaxID=3373602 RepID=UPI0037AE7440
MNPKKISVFIILVLMALLLTTFLSSAKSEKQQEDTISFLGLTIKYPTIYTFLGEKQKRVNTKALDSIVKSVKAVAEEPEETVNTITKVEDSIPTKEIPDYSKVDTTRLTRLVYPNKTRFLQKLITQLESDNCRILHYGDSQLEGDRISGYLRNRFQKVYGGGGPGFIPIKQVYDQISAKVGCSDNWLRYAAFDPHQEKLASKKYGVYMSVSRFTPYHAPKDSVHLDSSKLITAFISIGISNKTYANTRRFKKIQLHYGNAKQPVAIVVYNDGNVLRKDSLIADSNYHAYTINLKQTPTNLKIELQSKESPDFYGLTLDENAGISLDNIAMRGASGTIFVSQNKNNFKAMAANLQPKVVLLQYGGNTVPYLKDSTEVANYAKYLHYNINWIKKSIPQATYLFIGPTDMTTTINGNKVTYPLLPYLDSQLQQMCLKNNIAYWSMYHAMGGENSMPYWVEQQLAGEDYTHFTPKGSHIISELFFTALYLDIQEVKSHQKLVTSNE